MTKTREQYDLLACVDCGMYLANGDDALDGADPSWSPDHMEQFWPSAEWQVVNGDSEKDHDFSWRSCDLCGSKLGGARMHCVAWKD